MTYIVDTEVINPYGICLGEDLPRENYTPYTQVYAGRQNFVVWITSLLGTYEFYDNDRRAQQYYQITIDMADVITDYIRQAYNLSDDVTINADGYYDIDAGDGDPWREFSNGDTNTQRTQQTFETEEEALEYVDGLGNPDPLFTFDSNQILFEITWREAIDDIWVTRYVELTYTGENDIVLYTVDDFVNFFALFFEITPEEFRNKALSWYTNEDGDRVNLDNPPSLDCESYIKATILDSDGPASPIEIDIDFDGSSIPGDVTVTVIDGDPVVSNTMIENGDGAVTIHDNGNIIMSNDGGTFFLNEFGNVGFYANNDASLTANTQVQLGVGGTSVTVENDCFTFRDGTGNVELTADELTRLKALLD